MKSSNAMPIRSAVALVISVWMKPGAIALAVTPNLPSSIARLQRRAISIALLLSGTRR